MWDPNIVTNFNNLFKPYKPKENTKTSVNRARYDDNSYLHGDITADHTVDDIEKRWAKEDKEVWTPKYDNLKNPITKENQVWEKDKIRAHVERFFLLKQNIMREILESYGEYVGEIDYNKPKITYKSKIKDDKEDWNKNFGLALINNCYAALNGEFTIPASIIEYLKKRNNDGFIKKSKMPLTSYSKNKWSEAINRVREYVNAGFNEYVAMARVGQEWSEDSWNTGSTINTYERDGNGAKGTAGIGCGESRIGITFVTTKYAVIKMAHLEDRPNMGNCSSLASFKSTYNYGISQLRGADLNAALIAYCNFCGAWGKCLINLKTVKTELDMVIAICASYAFKAGAGNCPYPKNSNNVWDYINNTARGANIYAKQNKHEGFSAGIIVSYILGKVIKGEMNGDKNVQSIVDGAVKEVECLIGKLQG